MISNLPGNFCVRTSPVRNSILWTRFCCGVPFQRRRRGDRCQSRRFDSRQGSSRRWPRIPLPVPASSIDQPGSRLRVIRSSIRQTPRVVTCSPGSEGGLGWNDNRSCRFTERRARSSSRRRSAVSRSAAASSLRLASASGSGAFFSQRRHFSNSCLKFPLSCRASLPRFAMRLRPTSALSLLLGVIASAVANRRSKSSSFDVAAEIGGRAFSPDIHRVGSVYRLADIMSADLRFHSPSFYPATAGASSARVLLLLCTERAETKTI